MYKINKKNRIIIIIGVIILFLICIYFVYSKSDEGEMISSEERIENSIIENNTKEKEEKKENQEEKNKIIIHITGMISNEGILELEEGSRISDAIEKAGGLKEGADVSQINLAFILSDGMKIHIPDANDKEEKNADKTNTYITKESGVITIEETQNQNNVTEKNKTIAMVNINKADIKQLQTLPGIGDSTAQKIINYRNENGKFNSIEDIKNVKGIGDSKFVKIKEYITVK